MFLAHSFRLRDPWQCEAIELEGGGVRWSRAFHRPTGLEHDDALWLVCSGLPPGVDVSLNGERLAPCATGVCATGVPPVSPAERPSPYQFDVTNLIADTNRIDLAVPSDLASQASSLKPSPFPYDIRLAVVGHS